jgi:hypothetical protein
MNPAARQTLIAPRTTINGQNAGNAPNPPAAADSIRSVIRDNQTQHQQGKLRKEFFYFSLFHADSSACPEPSPKPHIPTRHVQTLAPVAPGIVSSMSGRLLPEPMVPQFGRFAPGTVCIVSCLFPQPICLHRTLICW